MPKDQQTKQQINSPCTQRGQVKLTDRLNSGKEKRQWGDHPQPAWNVKAQELVWKTDDRRRCLKNSLTSYTKPPQSWVCTLSRDGGSARWSIKTHGDADLSFSYLRSPLLGRKELGSHSRRKWRYFMAQALNYMVVIMLIIDDNSFQ